MWVIQMYCVDHDNNLWNDRGNLYCLCVQRSFRVGLIQVSMYVDTFSLGGGCSWEVCGLHLCKIYYKTFDAGATLAQTQNPVSLDDPPGAVDSLS